ncbi:MAG: T9SS type A sorting domain-containing protein [Flavobacteriales bacterium]|nr:T9SS type A sorting domain-containing protein [Flavobacteriales bacterium]
MSIPSTPLVHIAALLLTAWCQAQAPFNYKLVQGATGAGVSVLSVREVGPEVYRVSAQHGAADGLPYFSLFDMHADGTVQNGASVPVDTNISYKRIILPTADGGHLFSYLWATDGTDKQVYLKTDAAGQVEWNRYYPDNYALFLNDIEQGIVEKDGHYFTFGHSQDVPGNDGWACALVELDAVGALVARYHFAEGDDWSDIPKAILRTPENGLSTVSVLRPYFSAASFPQIAVQRWTADLELEWSRTYSFGNYHLLSSVNQLADGSLVISGIVRLAFNSSGFLPFIFKVDTNGDVVWARRTQGLTPELTDVLEEADGSLSAVGWVSDSQGTGRPLTASLGPDGALLQANVTEVGSYNLRPTELLHTNTGEYLVRYLSSSMLMRLDATLNFACGNEPYTWSDTLVEPVVVDFPVMLEQMDMLTSFDSTIVSTPNTFATTDLCLSTIMDPSADPTELHAWPVPTHGMLTVQLAAPSGQSIYRVIDALGRTVLTGRSDDTTRLQVDLSPMPSGMYTLVIGAETIARHITVLKE